jgi:anti-sigma factor RsiW
MSCATFAEARVLEACDEAAGPEWDRHVRACEDCAADVADFRAVRRVYATIRPLGLNARCKRSIVSRIRRERFHGRLRSALASLAGVAAAVLLLAGIVGAPVNVSAAVPVPSGSEIDVGLSEVRADVAGLEREERSTFDAALDDLKARVGLMSWDDENM